MTNESSTCTGRQKAHEGIRINTEWLRSGEPPEYLAKYSYCDPTENEKDYALIKRIAEIIPECAFDYSDSCIDWHAAREVIDCVRAYDSATDGMGNESISPTKQQVIKENKLCFACNPPDLDFSYSEGKEMNTQELVFCKYHARYLLSAISAAEYEENKYEE